MPSLPRTNNTNQRLILGIDVGTSGIRACLVQRNTATDNQPTIICEVDAPMPLPTRDNVTGASTQSPQIWLDTLSNVLKQLQHTPEFSQLDAIIVDATSSTVLLTTAEGQPLTTALMYNDTQAKNESSWLKKSIHHQSDSPVTSALTASSTLAKTLFLAKTMIGDRTPCLICHQIDFINGFLTGIYNQTDVNNALKLGFDPVSNDWHPAVKKLFDNAPYERFQLPIVLPVASPIATIKPSVAATYGLNPNVVIHTGTTDSIAGFYAAGANQVGDAVSSLGSTLAIKALAAHPCFNHDYGIYSHKVKSDWLIGGASNTGGAVLLNTYTMDEIKQLIAHITSQDIAYPWRYYCDSVKGQFYPLSNTGERFPIADSQFPGRNPPSPDKPFNQNEISKEHIQHFLAITQGLTDIETLAYQKVSELCLHKTTRLFSVGGGTHNSVWMQLRTQQIDATLTNCLMPNANAAFGVTQLL